MGTNQSEWYEYKNMRMSKETFNMLLEKVRPYIMRSFTNSFVQLNFDILFELVCLLFPAIFTMCFYERQNKEILSQRNKHLKGKTILFLIHYKSNV
jgi:hypothetical protein